jgi:hypothetical protein
VSEPVGPTGEENRERRGRFTINDIARLSGVSKKTVSRVINKSPYVKEDAVVGWRSSPSMTTSQTRKRVGWPSADRSWLA